MLLSMALVKAVTETTKKFDFNSVNEYLHESVTDLFVNAQDQPNCANFAHGEFSNKYVITHCYGST